MKRTEYVISLLIMTMLLYFAAVTGFHTRTARANYLGEIMRAGHVTARGLVKGPTGKPIFAKYDKNGKVTEVIAEAAGDFDGAFVMSGPAYRTHVKNYEDFRSEHENGIAKGAYILTREAYEDQDTKFQTVLSLNHEDPDPIAKPDLKPATFSVYVRAADLLIHKNTSPVLLESPIRLDDPEMLTVMPEHGSVLLGKKGLIKERALFNIGYRSAYYKQKDAPITDFSGDSAAFPRPGDVRVAPVKGVTVRCGRSTDVTDENGRFFMMYNIPPCPGFAYDYPATVWAELSYRVFNPKSETSSFSIWPVGVRTFERCNGLGHGGPELSVPGMAARAEMQTESVTAANMRYEIKADVILFTGKGTFKNPGGTPAIIKDQKTSYDPGVIPNADWPDDPEPEKRLVRGTLWDTDSDYLYDGQAHIWDADKDGLHDLVVADLRKGFVNHYSKGKEPVRSRPDFARNAQIEALEDDDIPDDMKLSPDMFGDAQAFVYKAGDKKLIHSEKEMEPGNCDSDGVYHMRFDLLADVQDGEAAEVVLTWRDKSAGYMTKLDTAVAVTEYNGITGPGVAIPLQDTYLKAPRYEIVQPGKPENQALLKSLSKEDMKDTDIYIFRQSDGQFVAERVGLTDSEVSDIAGGRPLVTFRITGRGPRFRDNTVGDFWTFHEGTAGTDLPEYQEQPDDLKTGGQVRAVIINRATGYIATASAEVGGTGISGTSPFADYYLGTFELRPPNLRIWAERTTGEIQKGLTQGKHRKNLINFEGSGLKSDTMAVIRTDWLDHDGSVLPGALPGYTGRLAKIVSPNTLTGVSPGDTAFFSIRPGHHIQLVVLPGDAEIGSSHFYVNVCGEPESRNPSFATPDDPDSLPELLKYRPEKYVPVLVPFFNREKTLRNAYARALIENLKWVPGNPAPVIKEIERLYDWVYRPELQFTLFELKTDNIELHTEYDLSAARGVTSLDFDYDILLPPDPGSQMTPKEFLRPLERFGGDRLLMFGLGYGEFLAYVAAAQHAKLSNLEDLVGMMPGRHLMVLENAMDLLEPEDYLGLQVYQADDPGNSLFEIYEFPLFTTDAKPFTLQQRHYNVLFDVTVPSDIGNIVNGYRSFEFGLLHKSKVSATIKYIKNGADCNVTVIGETELDEGPHAFLLDYKTAKAAGVDPSDPDISPNFRLVLRAEAVSSGSTQEAYFPGRMEEESRGPVLGQAMAHDVMIADGSLNISRQDFALKGRDPDLAFTRTYSNLQGDAPYEPLGYGWTHSLDLKLEPLCSEGDAGSGCVPGWVNNSLGKFFSPDSVPTDPEKWTSVSVNGTRFVKVEGKWYPQRGRHGKLKEEPEQVAPGAVPDYFIYTSKHGTRYKYKYPNRTKEEIPLYMSIGDDIITRIGMHPESLRLAHADPVIRTNSADKPRPTQVESIKDRNENEMKFEYEERAAPEQNLLVRVTDSVKREFEFRYEKVPAGWAGTRERLVKVTGLSDPHTISIEFEYNKRGQLMSARRAGRTETYKYEEEPDRKDADFNLTKITDANSHSHRYVYYEADEVPYDILEFVRTAEIPGCCKICLLS